MSKFIIECQSCGKYTEASNRFFAKKKIDCTCCYTIHVRTDKMASRTCPHCGNNVIFDQSKGDKALCPVCKEKINTTDSIFNKVKFSCPSCSCHLSVDKNAASYTCPLCDTVIDVQAQTAKEAVKNQGLASVIKYEGDNQTLVWKHPIEDFNFGSQLIVHESQEALFSRDGQALDLFGAGRYTLATQNLPALEKLYNLPVNDDTIFHSEVYFINQTVQMGIKWGTDTKVRLFDPATGLSLELGACGQFSLKVCDSRKLVVKLVGTASEFTHADVIDGGFGMKPTIAKFKAMIMTKVKSNLVQIIKNNQINVLELDENLDLISEKLRDAINPMQSDYGLVMPEFYITSITPDDDQNFQDLKKLHNETRKEKLRKINAEASAERQTVEAQTAARMKIIGAQGEAEAYKLKVKAEAAEMRMNGYTYQQETARQVGLGTVENMGGLGGSSGLGDLAGLGVSLGAMGSVINMTKDAMNPIANGAAGLSSSVADTMQDTWDCDCGNKHIVGNFCNNCGAKRPEQP
ncbi:MAG: SPFH domain-containing protein, partial [Ruminococcus sp.]|nr:SPFH domain-containing protein [Ruminococcus sp.]